MMHDFLMHGTMLAGFAGMAFTIRPGVREKIGLLFGVSGASGSGKTRTALLLATGIANGTGKIGVVDTEAGRALHYAPRAGEPADPAKGTFNFVHLDFQPPFTPERYIEAIRALEAEDCTVIVLDSATHEWLGEGGCSDMQAVEAERMAKAAAEKSGKNWEWMVDAMTAPAWKKPKLRHQRMMSRLIQTRTHLIFCMRAQEKIKIVDRKVVPIGFQPLCEKNFVFELSGSFMLHPDQPGCPDYGLPKKLNDDLQAIFPDGRMVGLEAGKRLRQWAESGADRAGPDKIAEGVRELVERIEDAADLAAVRVITADPTVVKQRAYLAKNRTDLAERVDDTVKRMLALFEPADDASDFPGDQADAA